TGLERGNNTYVWSVEAVDAAGNWSTAITGRSLSGQNPLSFIAAKSSLTTVNGDNSTDDGPIEGSTTVPVNPTIRLYFDRGVTTDAVWGNNQQCITLQDSTGKNVPVNVFRLGSTDTINDNLHYILIRPKSPLTAGKTYKIIISKNLTANNGRTLGENNGNKDEVVTFTVAAGSGSKGNGGGGGGGGAVTTEGPTSTEGSASVDPAMGATVSLGDMARVVIPANALKGTGSVKVEIKKVTRPPAIPPDLKLAGEVYEFSVDGRTTYDFAKKVALTLQFNPSRIGANEVPAIYFYDGPSSEWINLGGTVSGSTITVAVDHFTKYAVFAVPKPADPVEAPPPAGTFNDIAGHWAQSKIEELVALGVVNGYPDGSFKPDGTITRAEFTTMLVKAFELSPQTGKVFADTSRHWARDYIATAEAYRLVSGYNAGTFGPDDLITREQTALMIVKAAGLTMISEETSFADNSAISGWAKDAVATAVANGLMKGYPDNIFRPLGSATRAEAVTVILSALNPAKN
ncbi:MAG: S-layer homology domain-containing protein, partial [Pelotomaculaceae bacterium]